MTERCSRSGARLLDPSSQLGAGANDGGPAENSIFVPQSAAGVGLSCLFGAPVGLVVGWITFECSTSLT